MPRTSAEIIHEVRTSASLSQAELARRSGVPQPQISSYESGRHQPSFETLRRLVDAAGDRVRIETAASLLDPEEAARSLEAASDIVDTVPTYPRELRPGPVAFPRIPSGHR